MGWNMNVIMPIFGGVCALVMVVALVYAFILLRAVKTQTENQRSFLDSVEGLHLDHNEMKTLLNTITGKVSSIEKMIRDVE